MINEKCEQLIILFDGFLAQPKCQSPKEEFLEFIQQCFSVIALLTEHDAHILSIAKSLRVIPRSKAKQSIEEKLRKDLIEVEQSLNEDLRGFSCLLDMVLEEDTLKVDTAELICAMPEKYRSVAMIFCDLHLHFEAYNGLYLAFGADSREAETLLFLRAIRKVLVQARLWSEEDAEHVILDFLYGFVKNKTLGTIFELDLNYEEPRAVATYCEKAPEQARAILTVLMSIISAEHINVDSETGILLDKLLRAADLLGLEPFVESGFIGIEEKIAQVTGIQS